MFIEFGQGLLDKVILGFSSISNLSALYYSFLGTLLGTAVGVLPGLGPAATISVLLPLTYSLPPLQAMILLAGIYYGAQYGGSTTSILLGMPGEAASVATTVDGYRMTKRGAGAPALVAAGLASFLAGILGTLLIFTAAPLLSEVAFLFGPEEYCATALLSLVAAVTVSRSSFIHTTFLCATGAFLGLVGTDVGTGATRWTLGLPELSDGVSFVALSVGLFGYSEVIQAIISGGSTTDVRGVRLRASNYWSDLRGMWPAAFRGSAVGIFMGLLPGGGPVLASFVSHTLEQRVRSNDPIAVGQGNIRGVAGPEAANNGAAQSAFIPMLVLGIPPNASTALMLGAMTLHNLQPGPQVMSGNPTLFWGLVASMLVGNLMLVLLNIPLVGLWIKLLKVPRPVLIATIFTACTAGIWYSSSSPGFDLLLGLGFGILGYVLQVGGIESSALILAYVLSPMFEENFKRALALSGNSPTQFIARPISLTLLTAAALLAAIRLFSWVRSFRNLRS